MVSGYLHIPNEATDDFQGGGNTHAWCQVYLPGAGWVEFDPTNGIVGNKNLIRVAVAREPRQALHYRARSRALQRMPWT